LNKAVNAGLADPKLKARLTDLGSVPLPGPPATFGKLIADETEKWGRVIRFQVTVTDRPLSEVPRSVNSKGLESGVGQTRSFGDVGTMSGLPESGHGWAIYEYTP